MRAAARALLRLRARVLKAKVGFLQRERCITNNATGPLNWNKRKKQD